MAEDLMKCNECQKPLILYEWFMEDEKRRNEPTQGPTTHPDIKEWCDGECSERALGGGWNHRLIIYKQTPGYEDLPAEMGIHEVFYNKNKNPSAVTMHPVGIVADSIDGIREVLSWFEKALAQPPIDMEYFENLKKGKIGRKDG